MQRDDSVYVGHILDMARKALEKIRGMSRSEYDADEDLRMALTHLIQTVGEAARGVSPAFQQRHDSVPWRQIIGMRHKVVHGYLHVDYDLVWDVVTADLPQLVAELERITRPDDSG